MRTRPLSVVLVSVLLLTSGLGIGAVGAELTGSDAAPSIGVSAPAQASNIGGSPDLNVFAPNPNLVPGQTNQISLQIANDGEFRFGNAANSDLVTTARNVQAEVEASGPLSVESGETSIGSVTTSAPGELPVSLNVPQGVEPGTYSLDLDLTYNYISSGESRTVTVFRDVEVRVRDDARFQVVDIDSDAQIGDSGTVEATIENVGAETAHNADV
ncbi:exo-alpha-sialidase, partial [Halorubrum ezzemoulense]|uniref:COG1361 S-layer family protein n=1 Tax=Halorubrum ezzemoulense TaxID=337243 RepID=UPI00280E0623|nr:exo-alpha-sialidase [Halorubrum ezzemoulense]